MEGRSSTIPNIPQPLFSKPYLLVEDEKKVLVAADLHLGIEREMMQRGLQVPSGTERITGDIAAAGRKEDAHGLVLVGDVKHSIPGTSHQEHREIPEAMDRLLETFDEVHIIPGNHDAGLENMIQSRVSLHPATGCKIGSITFSHGHCWPSVDVMDSDLLIIGHNHPNVTFENTAGGLVSQPCWVRGKLKGEVLERYPKFGGGVIMMPASTPYGTGVAVNRKPPEFLGPLVRGGRLERRSARIFSLDGVELGNLSKLPAVKLRRPRQSFRRTPARERR